MIFIRWITWKNKRSELSMKTNTLLTSCMNCSIEQNANLHFVFCLLVTKYFKYTISIHCSFNSSWKPGAWCWAFFISVLSGFLLPCWQMHVASTSFTMYLQQNLSFAYGLIRVGIFHYDRVLLGEEEGNVSRKGSLVLLSKPAGNCFLRLVLTHL